MSHWSLQCPGKFKSSMVISVLSLLFPLTFGFKISLWVQSLHLKESGCRNTGNFGMQNHESTACNPKSKTVLHILTLGRVQPSCWSCRVFRSSSWTQIMHVMSKLRHRNLPLSAKDYHCFQCCDYTIFKGYIICRVIIKGFLIHEQVKTNADKIKPHAHIVNLS